MGNKKKVEEEVILTVEPEVTTEEPTVEPEVTTEGADEVPEESVKNGLILSHGIVTASKLNVRKEADKEADVLTVISKGTGVGIDLANSTDEFYCVQVIVDAELATGYCMKEFITTN